MIVYWEGFLLRWGFADGNIVTNSGVGEYANQTTSPLPSQHTIHLKQPKQIANDTTKGDKD